MYRLISNGNIISQSPWKDWEIYGTELMPCILIVFGHKFLILVFKPRVEIVTVLLIIIKNFFIEIVLLFWWSKFVKYNLKEILVWQFVSPDDTILIISHFSHEKGQHPTGMVSYHAILLLFSEKKCVIILIIVLKYYNIFSSKIA